MTIVISIHKDESVSDEAPETKTVTLSGVFPADMPDLLCRISLVVEFWRSVNLRKFRHRERARTEMMRARRGSQQALYTLQRDPTFKG